MIEITKGTITPAGHGLGFLISDFYAGCFLSNYENKHLSDTAAFTWNELNQVFVLDYQDKEMTQDLQMSLASTNVVCPDVDW